MSLEETKKLLRTHRIIPKKFLGQNFMVEPMLYPNLYTYCGINQSDVVLDAGAGLGFLACFLADKCKAVVAVEKDPQIARVLREQIIGISNVTVIEGDILKSALPQFNKVVAIPPYYLSSHLLTWPLLHKIDCAVMILQKAFAKRLVAPVGSEDYGWLSVVTYQGGTVELLDDVPNYMFFPQPKVASIILRLKPKNVKPFEVNDAVFFTRMIKWLFTQRNKKLGKALIPFIRSNFKLNKREAEKLALNMPFNDRRVRELSPEIFGELVNALPN